MKQSCPAIDNAKQNEDTSCNASAQKGTSYNPGHKSLHGSCQDRAQDHSH
jgi:hypothetical protein